LTYGTITASYIATKCSQVVSKEARSIFLKAVHAISSKLYMNDLLTAVDSVEKVLTSIKYSNYSRFLKSSDDLIKKELRPVGMHCRVSRDFGRLAIVSRCASMFNLPQTEKM